jgi:hypothetical protein
MGVDRWKQCFMLTTTSCVLLLRLQVLLQVMGSTQVQAMRKAFNTWDAYVDHRRKKYAAQHHHSSCLTSKAWKSWRGTLASARAKEAKAQQLAVMALHRMQNQVLHTAFTEWRVHVRKMRSLKVRVRK